MNEVPDPVAELGQPITAQMKKVLDYLAEYGQITDAEICDLLGLKKTRAFTVAKQMRDMGLIQVVGRGENRKYTNENKNIGI